MYSTNVKAILRRITARQCGEHKGQSELY